MSREHTSQSKQPFATTQETTLYTDIIKWSILKSDWLYFCSQRWRNSIQSTETRPGADCGSDHQLLIAKSRLKFKKVGKITRQFRYDLSKIPYDYIVEVMNGVNSLDLPEEQWMALHNIVQETVTKTILKKKKKNARRKSGCLRRLYK